MANYCITKYWVEGEKDVLEKMAALIGDGRKVTEILPKIGMPFSDLSYREEGCPYWYEAEIKDGILCFTEEAKWEQSQCLWKLRDREQSGINDIKYYSVVSESDFYQTNDAEGKHFPYRVSVFCDTMPDTDPPHFYVVSEENTYLFRAREEMLSYFARRYGWRADSEVVYHLHRALSIVYNNNSRLIRCPLGGGGAFLNVDYSGTRLFDCPFSGIVYNSRVHFLGYILIHDARKQSWRDTLWVRIGSKYGFFGEKSPFYRRRL